MPTVLFRCDGGPEIGLGHIMRCRALAFAFEERGWTSRFAVSKATAAYLKDQDPIVVPEGLEGAPFVKHILQNEKIECLVVDHYGLDAEFEDGAATAGMLLVAIDDLPGRQHRVDVLVDPNPARIFDDYTGYVGPRTDTGSQPRLLVRSRYAMLRPEFAKARERGQFRMVRRVPRKLLIALGGADPDNFSAQVIEEAPAFRAAGVATTLVVGQANLHQASLRQRCRELGVKFVCNPPNLIRMVASADIAISGAGTTCYEFACLGIPTVALIIAENQRGVGQAIASIGAASIVDCRTEVDRAHVAKKVAALASDRLLRERMSAAAQAMVDGHGARSVVQEALLEMTRRIRKG